MSNIPHEIIVQILSRLPVKSLCRFKCVSKPWRFLISEPNFIKMHMNQTQKLKLILAATSLHLGTRPLYSIDLDQFDNDNGSGDIEAIELDYPPEEISWINIIGSCNGLICLTFNRYSYSIYNPSTREFKNVAHSLLRPDVYSWPYINAMRTYYPLSYEDMMSTFGFGYAPAVDDCILVKGADDLVSVFSLRTMIGRHQFFPYTSPCHYFEPGIPLNGALHWLVSCIDEFKKWVIAAVDLAEATCKELPVPDDVTGYFTTFSIGVLDGFICLMHFTLLDEAGHNEFWVMKEYGVKESWTKIEINFSYHVLKPMCLMKNKKALFAMDMKQFVLCNLENGICEDVAIRGLPDEFTLCIYEESLVSPNIGNGRLGR